MKNSIISIIFNIIFVVKLVNNIPFKRLCNCYIERFLLSKMSVSQKKKPKRMANFESDYQFLYNIKIFIHKGGIKKQISVLKLAFDYLY